MLPATPKHLSAQPRKSSTPERTSASTALGVGFTHRLQSSSSLGLSYRILNINLNQELSWSLWV